MVGLFTDQSAVLMEGGGGTVDRTRGCLKSVMKTLSLGSELFLLSHRRLLGAFYYASFGCSVYKYVYFGMFY